MAYLAEAEAIVRHHDATMDVIPIIEGAHLVRLPNGSALLVGAPPEAVKVLLLWEWPTPRTVVLAPDPLYAHGINQASLEFLLFNYLFRERGLGSGQPFTIVCDASQKARVEVLAHEMLRGPDEAQMAAWGTPEGQRRQLRREMEAVGGVLIKTPLEQLIRIVPLVQGTATLADGTRIEDRPPDDCLISTTGASVRVPRRPRGRGTLPFFFAEPEHPSEGAGFGIQVIGSGSGFSPGDWGSCFIVWINGLPLVVDGTPYLDEHLERLGIEEEQVTGYLITHNHEDHANAIGQLVNRRRVTVLTAAPVMAGLVRRLGAILGRSETEIRRMLDWVPLRPGLDRMGPARHWFGAEIRSWYSVHTVPTVGVEISLGGQRIRMPGDTLWGRQLEPLVADGTLTRARERFIQASYEGADIVVADAGGGPIHPDPKEVSELQHQSSHRLLATHTPLEASTALQNARSGAVIALRECPPLEPADLLALTTSAPLRGVSERWLLAFLNGGEALSVESGDIVPAGDALAILRGSVRVDATLGASLLLQRGDLFHPDMLPGAVPGHAPSLVARGDWTRVLRIPGPLLRHFLHATGLGKRLRRLYETRGIWAHVTQAELPLETLLALARAGQSRQFDQGATILEEGDRPDNFHVVVAGHVEVTRTAAGRRQRLGYFGPGYSFGETGLLDGAPRNATVRAIDQVTTLEISARAFQDYLLNIPIAHFNLARTRDQRLPQGPE